MNAPANTPRGSGTRGEPIRRPLEARFVGVLDNRNDGRGLALIKAHTRVVRRYDIHELILTDEQSAIGTIAGFDESHCPNHYNVLIKGPRRITGVELQQRPGDLVIFLPPA